MAKCVVAGKGSELCRTEGSVAQWVLVGKKGVAAALTGVTVRVKEHVSVGCNGEGGWGSLFSGMWQGRRKRR